MSNPLLAIALALAGALLATLAAVVYANRRTRRRIAELRRQRPACAARQLAEAPRHCPAPVAPGLRLSAADVARPLPKQLRHQGDRLVVVARVRRPRNN